MATRGLKAMKKPDGAPKSKPERGPKAKAKGKKMPKKPSVSTAANWMKYAQSAVAQLSPQREIVLSEDEFGDDSSAAAAPAAKAPAPAPAIADVAETGTDEGKQKRREQIDAGVARDGTALSTTNDAKYTPAQKAVMEKALELNADLAQKFKEKTACRSGA